MPSAVSDGPSPCGPFGPSDPAGPVLQAAHYRHLADVVRNNLENQQDWTELRVHDGDGVGDRRDSSRSGGVCGDDDCIHGSHGSHGSDGGARVAGDGAGGDIVSSTANDGSQPPSSPPAPPLAPLPRILLSGRPPRRLYVHPDEQIAILRAERALGHGRRIPQPPEYEWVLPIHLAEMPSVSLLASVFDSIAALPPGAVATLDDSNDGDDADAAQWKVWRGPRRGKRLLLAVVQDDSSVVYYFMHDGIVKPRQN